MKPIEVISSLPQWAKASPEEILASPAWAMPCRLGEAQCTMRLDETRPAETLDLSVALDGEEHVVGIADSEAFPDLHAVWASRAEVPEQVLLAIVEKDCGPLLQLIENAVRRQLKISGLAAAPAAPDSRLLCARVEGGDAQRISFTLTLSPSVENALGQLRCIDPAHPSVRETRLAAETEYASFVLPSGDLASLSPGDALLLPEIGSISPRLVIEGLFVVSEGGVARWNDDGILRVCAAEPSAIDAGALLDAASGEKPLTAAQPQENAQLKLVRSGAILARGHLGRIGSQSAFLVESAANG